MVNLDDARERALETLTKAYTADAIPVSEFERRASLVQKARDQAEIDVLVADLPRTAPTDRPISRATSTNPALAGSQSVACVMGERHLQGDWLSGDRVQNFTLMGSVKLDLRDAPLPPEGLRIEAFVCMGETTVIVPRGLAVRLNAVPFMGEASAARDVAQRANPGEPVVRIDGFVLMGSLRVVVAKD